MACIANSGTTPEGNGHWKVSLAQQGLARPMRGEPMSPSVWMFLVMTKNFFVMTKKRGGVWASAG
jgi:hypothetical protein